MMPGGPGFESSHRQLLTVFRNDENKEKDDRNRSIKK